MIVNMGINISVLQMGIYKMFCSVCVYPVLAPKRIIITFIHLDNKHMHSHTVNSMRIHSM